ncbi:MAG: beta-propeller domain-containing protein [Thermoleophilia bacterium]
MVRRSLGGGMAGLMAAAAMGGGMAGGVPAAEAAPAPLSRFASCERFTGYVQAKALPRAWAWGLTGYASPIMMRERLGGVEDSSAAAPRAAAPAPVAGSDYSDTNVQEAGVDEPDLVETDGRTLYAIAGGRLRVADVSTGVARELDSFAPDGATLTGLLLMGDRLVALGDADPERSSWAPRTPAARSAAFVAMPAAQVRTVAIELDVSDPSHVRVLSRMALDGHLVSARATGTTVRLVTQSAPSRVPLVYSTSSAAADRRAARQANRRAIRRSAAGAWLPRLAIINPRGRSTASRVAVGCRDVARPAEFAGFGMLTVVTVGVGETLSVLDSDAVMADGELVYASPTSLYVATSRWIDPAAADGAAPPPRGATRIHRFDTSVPDRTEYRSSGVVAGYVLNQFSMSERDGVLRVATTEEPAWWSPGDDEPGESAVTTLTERDGRLVRLGRAGGLGRGERIYAVRFLGDLGYVVTFRRTDPLYVVDLSDPAKPVVRGELKIPGFSSYLHPAGDGLLIGVGQAATGEGRTLGTQVSLFDVTDPANPRRLAARTLDLDWSSAEQDHHAFLFWPQTGLVVVPGQRYGESGDSFLGAVGLRVGRDVGVAPIARIDHPSTGDERDPVLRSVVVGDTLYTISDAGIRAGDLTTLGRRAWTAWG